MKPKKVKKVGRSPRPRMNLDEIELESEDVGEEELCNARGIEFIPARPITEIALRMNDELRAGKKIKIRVTNDRHVLTYRRLLMEDLDKLAGFSFYAKCIEHGTELTFSYVRNPNPR